MIAVFGLLLGEPTEYILDILSVRLFVDITIERITIKLGLLTVTACLKLITSY